MSRMCSFTLCLGYSHLSCTAHKNVNLIFLLFVNRPIFALYYHPMISLYLSISLSLSLHLTSFESQQLLSTPLLPPLLIHKTSHHFLATPLFSPLSCLPLLSSHRSSPLFSPLYTQLAVRLISSTVAAALFIACTYYVAVLLHPTSERNAYFMENNSWSKKVE